MDLIFIWLSPLEDFIFWVNRFMTFYDIRNMLIQDGEKNRIIFFLSNLRISNRKDFVSNQGKIIGDFLLLWSLNKRTKEGKFLCDFTSQKVWIILWQIMNILGLLGLVISMGRWDLI